MFKPFSIPFLPCECGGEVHRLSVYRSPGDGFRVCCECPKCGLTVNGFGTVQKAFDDCLEVFAEISHLGYSRYLARYYPDGDADLADEVEKMSNFAVPRPDVDNCRHCPLWDDDLGCLQNPMEPCPLD